MKTKLIFILALLSLICVLHADYQNNNKDSIDDTKTPQKQKAKEMGGVSKVTVENRTRHNLKITFSDKNNKNIISPDDFKYIKAEAKGDNAPVYTSEKRNLLAYNGSKFNVEIISQTEGIQTPFKSATFTGENNEYDLHFDYKPDLGIASPRTKRVHLHVSVSYSNNSVTMIFTAPDEDRAI